MTNQATRLLCLLFLLLGSRDIVTGQSVPAQLPAGTILLGEPEYGSFHLTGEDTGKAEFSTAAFDTPAGPKAGFRFTMHEAAKQPLAIQAVAANPRAIATGDTLFAHFFMRTTSSELESGEGKLQFILEDAKTYDKSIQFPATTANDWKEFNLPFTSRGSYQPGEAHVIFRLGYRRQTVEIAGLEITDCGPSVPVASLPMTKPDLSYPGMEADAPWRAAAADRIAKIRKSPLTVQVIDSTGSPVAGANVAVKQIRHAFWFGSAVGAKILLDSATGEDKRFSQAVLDNFNLVTFENDLKWPQWEHERELPLQAARWCQEHGIALRGHNLVWPSWRHMPPRMKELETTPAALRRAVLSHVSDISTALSPYATLWDVINEPFDNHNLMDVLGRDILKDIYQEAHAAAPGAKLFINDYGIVSGNGADRAHQDHYEQTIQFLQDQDAPLQGIGIQGHFGQEYTSPERIYAILDRFARFHLPLQMTEFSAQADDLEMDAKVLRDVMTIFFSHPAVNAFILWGFYDAHGFPQKANLFDAEGQLTPAGRVYRDLVFHQWWTQENATTGADGTARIEGFHGSYEITVSSGGKSVVKQVELPAGGATLNVALERF